MCELGYYRSNEGDTRQAWMWQDLGKSAISEAKAKTTPGGPQARSVALLVVKRTNQNTLWGEI